MKIEFDPEDLCADTRRAYRPLPNVLRLSDQEIVERFDAVAEVLRDGRPLIDLLKPPPGPYALFSHQSHASERIRDVRVIFERLLDARHGYTRLNAEINEARPADWPAGVPFPQPVAGLMVQADGVNHALKLDYESLFHFGGVLLDQWAFAAGYLAGVERPQAFHFHLLAEHVEGENPRPALRPIRQGLLAHTRWLHFWMRTYRNRFVVHATRPWQRGTVWTERADDFALFTPSPPGWVDDAAVATEIGELLAHAPEWLQNADPNYWEKQRPLALLGRVIENIGRIDRQQIRDRVAELANRSGVTTPTFQVVASVLADFLYRATPLVLEAALAAPHEIKLGRSGE